MVIHRDTSYREINKNPVVAMKPFTSNQFADMYPGERRSIHIERKNFTRGKHDLAIDVDSLRIPFRERSNVSWVIQIFHPDKWLNARGISNRSMIVTRGVSRAFSNRHAVFAGYFIVSGEIRTSS